MQILIPMAGAGSRFVEAGFLDPKPLIDVNGLPMIQQVIYNLGLDYDYIFIAQKSTLDKYRSKLEEVASVAKSAKFLSVDGLTRGAAETCLLAKDYLDPSRPLMIANCDQIMEWDSNNFYTWFNSSQTDGAIITFNSDSNKNSYVQLDDDGWVKEAREKIVISNLATTGVYVWRRAEDFIWAAEEMIAKDIRHNNEFYVCPVYNQNILRNQKINTYHITKHWPIGTPEDLEEYLNRMINLVEYPIKKTPTRKFGLLNEFSIEPEHSNWADWTSLCYIATTPAFSESNRIELAKYVEPWMRTIVEIGVSRDGWESSSSKVLIENKHDDCNYFGIDIEDREWILEKGKNVYFKKNSSYEIDENISAIKKLGNEYIDLLFIDGDHSVNSVIKEWTYAEYVNPNGGIIVLHDTNLHPGPWCLIRSVDTGIFEVTRLCESENDYGMAVLRRI